jgi:hypothetical protein
MSFMHRFFQGVEYLQQAKLDAPFWAWNSVMERMHLHERVWGHRDEGVSP